MWACRAVCLAPAHGRQHSQVHAAFPVRAAARLELRVAYAGSADAYAVLPIYATVHADSVYDLPKAARRALALDSTLAEPHAALGLVHIRAISGQGGGRAGRLAISPYYSTAYQWLGKALAEQGLLAEGESDRAPWHSTRWRPSPRTIWPKRSSGRSATPQRGSRSRRRCSWIPPSFPRTHSWATSR